MSELVYLTTCKLCTPGQEWQIDGKGCEPARPMLGEQPSKRTERFFLALYAHLQDRCTAEFQEMAGAQKSGRFNGNDAASTAAWCLAHGRHIAAFRGVLAATQCAQAFTILSAFNSQDPELRKSLEIARYQLHSFSRPPLEQFTDQALKLRYENIYREKDPPGESRILDLIKDIRDQLLGLGVYTPDEFQGTILQAK